MNLKKRTKTLAGLCLLAGGLAAQNVCVSTPRTSLLLKAPVGGELEILYYGQKLADADLAALETDGGMGAAYPAYGMNSLGETALAVQQADGNLTLQLVVEDVSSTEAENSSETVVRLKDTLYPFYVDVCYRAYKDVDVIEAWTEITNEGKKPVTLHQFASACLPIRRGQVWMSHLHGSWANEARLAQEPLTAGMKVIANRDGVRNAQTDHAEVMFSLDGRPRENEGRVIGAALCYGGNYKLRVDTRDDECHHFFAGINEENSAYVLEGGETFVTPELALTYSNEGLSGASRSFHRWGRAYKLAHGERLRKILLNSWEGVYFGINQEGMEQMMADIASMGGELFVMDDGWFGDKYPRDNDTSSLGDWVVDKRKLPRGIEGLLADAKKHGIKFGIWVEPEMTNRISELYEQHPDWIVKAPGRDPVQGRGGTQLVLDLSNPDVQDYVFGVVDELMTKYPEIDYIKWDANMSILNHGSQYLPADRQSHLFIEYHRGLEQVCQRLRAKYPDLVIQACASGGGRANWGILPYFDEFWVSDNTDALQRIYMQWGTSYFFPAMAMASHISAAPNHQTSRVVPLKYRIDVAMSGRLGMEIQPKHMTDAEKELCRKAIAEYKTIRPVVQLGDIYRLLSPYDHLGAASLMYVAPEKNKAVFFWWKTEHFYNQHLPRVPMRGLQADKLYKVHELNRIDTQPLPCEGKVFSGAFLMANGLELPYNHRVNTPSAYASRVLYLEEVE